MIRLTEGQGTREDDTSDQERNGRVKVVLPVALGTLIHQAQVSLKSHNISGLIRLLTT